MYGFAHVKANMVVICTYLDKPPERSQPHQQLQDERGGCSNDKRMRDLQLAFP